MVKKDYDYKKGRRIVMSTEELRKRAIMALESRQNKMHNLNIEECVENIKMKPECQEQTL